MIPLVTLEPISQLLASRIIAGLQLPGDNWHEQYPFADEIIPLQMLLALESPDPVFTQYQVRAADGRAVGGIGFFGPPDGQGVVELGYGFVPAARGRGLATAALLEAVSIAGSAGALAIIADATLDNLPSQRVLARAGFLEERRDDRLVYFRRMLANT